MKNYRQLVKELPSKKVVFAFGRFQPPTTGHELLVKAVKKIAGSTADHVIFASKSEDKKSNPLPVGRKVYYLKRMFPGTNFQAANQEIRTFIEAAKALNKKYKNIVMVAGSDRVPEYTRLLNTYNGKDFHFDTIEVVSAGERDPDADNASGMSGTKMREAAKKGDFELFKKGVPHTLTDLDARRLMNDIRKGMGLDVIKEQFNLVKDDLREQYFRGEIFNIGDIVESAGEQFEIVKRGTNHLLVKSSDGSLVSKWLKDVTVVQESAMNEDLTDKTLKNSDKIKVARIIADAFGVDNAEQSSGPEQLVNAGLRKIKSKPFNADSLKIIGNMLQLAAEVGIKYDNNLVPTKLKEGTIQPNGTDKIEVTTTYANFKKKLKETEQDVKNTESDHDADYDNAHSEVGHNLASQARSETLRRMKVKHHLGESFEAAEAHKAKADEAKAKGDQEAYHHHMSNHHEEMGKWHESKGRHQSADASFNKAEEHHEASLNVSKVQKEEKAGVQEEPAGKHRIQVTISDPNHSAVTKRKEQIQKHIRVSGEHSKEDAIKKATAHYKKQGYKVHSAEHVGMVKEEIVTEGYEDHHLFPDYMQKILKKNEQSPEEKAKHAAKRAALSANTKPATPQKHEPYKPLGGRDEHSGRSYSEAKEIEVKEPETAYIQRGNITEDELETSDIKVSKSGRKVPAHRFKVGDAVKKDVEEGFDPFFQPNVQENDDDFEDISDDEMEKMASGVDHEDHIMDLYDDGELTVIDSDTGEEIKDDVKEEAINEVLSRAERMRAKIRFARTQSKRERRLQIALHSRSTSTRLNQRARKLAVKMMKQRMAKKPLDKLSVAEKERIERVIQRRKAVISRLAMKLAPRIRKIENDRLTNKKVTK